MLSALCNDETQFRFLSVLGGRGNATHAEVTDPPSSPTTTLTTTQNPAGRNERRNPRGPELKNRRT